MDSKKAYRIDGKDYFFKDKYSLKDWGNILNILNNAKTENPVEATIHLLAEDKLINLLNLILSENVAEVYEDDFKTVNEIITDFFSRESSLLKSGTASQN